MSYLRSVGPSEAKPPYYAPAHGAQEYTREIPKEEPAKVAEGVERILETKLRDPSVKLSSDQSLLLLTECINRGEIEAEKARGRNLVVVIGNTGAGKSTFVNWLYGCKMARVSRKTIGIGGIGSVVVVDKGSSVKEVMAIGHSKLSMTFMPQIEQDKCDCPGFLDNRGVEINIANAVNIKKAFVLARSVKVVMLINYHSLKAEKARGLNEMIKICCDLFGTKENLTQYESSILLGVTQVPQMANLDEIQDLEDLKTFIREPKLSDPFSQTVLECLAKRLFIYDPVDTPNLEFRGSMPREAVFQELESLTAIDEPSNIFKTVLTPDDIFGLQKICDDIKAKIDATLKGNSTQEGFRLVAAYLESLRKLEIIEHPYAIKLLHETRNLIIQHFTKLKDAFNQSCADQASKLSVESEKILITLRNGVKYFDEEVEKAVDLGELERRFALHMKKIDAQKIVSELREKEAAFYSFCQMNNFLNAELLLTEIKAKAASFSQEYAKTGVQVGVNVENLQQHYTSSKTNYDTWVRADLEVKDKMKKMEEATTELQKANERSAKMQEKELAAIRETNLQLKEGLERQKREAEAEKQKAKEKMETLRKEAKEKTQAPSSRSDSSSSTPYGMHPMVQQQMAMQAWQQQAAMQQQAMWAARMGYPPGFY